MQPNTTTTINPNEDFKLKRDMNPQEAINLLRRYGMKFFSWGAQAFRTIGTLPDGYCKALRFKTNGHHHKGHVYLSVNANDLYDVVLTSVSGVIKESITDIYFEDLFEILDKKIEYIEKYGSK